MMRKKIEKITEKYGVKVVSCVRNIQCTFDVELNESIYYKAQARMETEIRALGNINDIYYTS